MSMYEKELPPINALICVGNDHISGPIYEYIKRSGANKTTIATNSVAALNECYDEEYHFFLIAQELPGEDGLDLIEKMQKKGFINKKTRVILLMEAPNKENAVKARGLGIEHLLIPPFTLQKISDRMKTIYKPLQKKPATKPRGAALIAKNGHLAAQLKKAKQAQPTGTVGMKIHAPHETANLILKDQKIIRKPRKATAGLATKSEPKRYQGEVLPQKKQPPKVLNHTQPPEKSAPTRGQRPIESLPPYPGITKAQQAKLDAMAQKTTLSKAS